MTVSTSTVRSTKHLLQFLPWEVRREINKRNTTRGKKMARMLSGKAQNEQGSVWDDLRRLWPQVDFNAAMQKAGLLPDEETVCLEPVPVVHQAEDEAPPMEAGVATIGDPKRLTVFTGLELVNAALSPLLELGQSADESKLMQYVEAAYAATKDIGGGRCRWNPWKTIHYLQSQGSLPEGQSYAADLEAKYIHYADPVRVRTIREKRNLSRQQFTEKVAVLTPEATVGYWARFEDGAAPCFGDRLTAAAEVLGVEEELLLPSGPPIPDQLPPFRANQSLPAPVTAPTPALEKLPPPVPSLNLEPPKAPEKVTADTAVPRPPLSKRLEGLVAEVIRLEDSVIASNFNARHAASEEQGAKRLAVSLQEQNTQISLRMAELETQVAELGAAPAITNPDEVAAKQAEIDRLTTLSERQQALIQNQRKRIAELEDLSLA